MVLWLSNNISKYVPNHIAIKPYNLFKSKSSIYAYTLPKFIDLFIIICYYYVYYYRFES